MGQPYPRLSPPILDFPHLQDHFRFTVFTSPQHLFSRCFSDPILDTSNGTVAGFLSSVNLLTHIQHGSKIWVSPFFAQKRSLLPSPRFRDCTIHFANCKSLLSKKHHRQMTPPDATCRWITTRIEQIICFCNSLIMAHKTNILVFEATAFAGAYQHSRTQLLLAMSGF